MISKKKKFIFFRIPKSASKSMDFALSNQYINLPVEYTCSDSGSKSFKKRLFSKHLSFFHFNLSFDDPWFTINGKKTIKQKLGSEDTAIQDYYKFCFTRNPWERTLSYFTGKIPKLFPLHREKIAYPQKTRRRFCKFLLSSAKDFIDMPLEQKLKQNRWPNSTKRGKRYNDFGHYSFFTMQQIQYMTDDMTPQGKNVMDYVGSLDNIESDIKNICSEIDIKFSMPDGRIGSSKHGHYSLYYDDTSREIVSQLFADDIRIFNYSFEDRK